MSKNYTDLTVLLDRSGSMHTIKEGMEGAFDTFLKKHREVPSTKITLIQFDDRNDQDVVYQACPVGSAEGLNLQPRGNTPLLDAMCKAIDNTGSRLAGMDESKRPNKVLMVIITDGQENSSKIYERKDVFNRVTKQREDYKWQFVYLGANQDTFHEARSYGFDLGQTITYTASPFYVGGNSPFVRSLATNTYNYTSGNSNQVLNFTEDDRTKAATEEDRKRGGI